MCDPCNLLDRTAPIVYAILLKQLKNLHLCMRKSLIYFTDLIEYSVNEIIKNYNRKIPQFCKHWMFGSHCNQFRGLCRNNVMLNVVLNFRLTLKDNT